jgi:hypothetical protein
MPKVSPDENVKMTIQGSKLIIEVELDNVDTTESKSGKSMIIATTSGNRPVRGRPEIKIGLNIYKPSRE